MSVQYAMTTIGELCRKGGGNVQTGPFGSQLKASAYVEEGIPVVMPADIIDFRVSVDSIAQVGKEDHKRLSRHQLIAGDIIYGRRGDIGRHALITEREEGWLCGTGCLRIRFGSAPINPRYISYYLRQEHVIDLILGKAVGTTMANLNTGILESVPIELPPRRIQDKVADILGSLDDKIEVNRRISATLEAMGRALFKHWFVDFGPFQDGPFVETELGVVPEGWGTGSLGDIGFTIRDIIDPQQQDPDTPYIGLADMPQGTIVLGSWGKAADSISVKNIMKRGQLLFGKLRPYFKKVGISPLDGVCSTDILVIEPKRLELFGLVLGYITTQDFIDYTISVSDGTRMPRVSWTMMAKYPTVIPPRHVARQFNDLVKPWVDIIGNKVFESRALAATRDYLLPRLLSGEVAVEAVETATVETAAVEVL